MFPLLKISEKRPTVTWSFAKCVQFQYGSRRGFSVKLMSMFDFHVHSTLKLHRICINSKFRFRYEQVIIRAEKVKTQIEAGVIPKLSNIFGSYVNSTSKQHQEKKNVKKSSIFYRFWKFNQHRVIHLELMSVFRFGFAFHNRWNVDELSM